jgi:hypothetical protein
MSYNTGAICVTGTANPSGASEFTPGLSLFSLLCCSMDFYVLVLYLCFSVVFMFWCCIYVLVLYLCFGVVFMLNFSFGHCFVCPFFCCFYIFLCTFILFFYIVIVDHQRLIVPNLVLETPAIY